MELKIYQVDAFAANVFEGNPAAVVPLDSWLPEHIMQNIAEENNVSETAFFVNKDDIITLRWFTPDGEVDLCGHATLAAAHVLFKHLDYSLSIVEFQTRSGSLIVAEADGIYRMDFPASMPKKIDIPDELISALGVIPKAVYIAFDYIVELESEAEVLAVTPDFATLLKLDYRGVVITSLSDNYDFVSRCFFPKYRVNEDPVTGSAHCELAPLWAQKLDKLHLKAKQLSKRTGIVDCEVIGNRVILEGRASDYMIGTISINL